jgi:hypothetical protein
MSILEILGSKDALSQKQPEGLSMNFNYLEVKMVLY